MKLFDFIKVFHDETHTYIYEIDKNGELEKIFWGPACVVIPSDELSDFVVVSASIVSHSSLMIIVKK